MLAIAGLIFLMVFIALPALQRSQRDTQRRDDVSRVVSQLNSYATNNRGNLPTNQNQFNAFVDGYLKVADGEFKDPQSGNDYSTIFGQPNTFPNTSQIQYVRGGTCDNENIRTGGGARQAAVRIQLEGSGYFCQTVQ